MTPNDTQSLFRSLDESGSGRLHARDILKALANAGLEILDPRLIDLRSRLDELSDSPIDLTGFNQLVDGTGQLLARAQKGELIIPDFKRFTRHIEEIFEAVADDDDGQVADYIPQLARVQPNQFAVSICTIDGQSMQFGNAETPFTLQSSCKPLLYCAALEELGEHCLHQHVGREPSGLSFNELTLNRGGLPHNPMINAGAIMTSSLIRRQMSTADRLEFLTDLITTLSGGRSCHFNTAVWHSERETADRNFALAHHMRERGAFPEGTQIQSTLDYYFSACSIEVTATSVATIASTLANGGACPATGVRIFGEETVKNCLSMMNSCGMYDYSGEFAFTVGIPAKSSVSGVVLAVIPNVMGVAVWSPRLDACGNSVRGVAFLRKLVDTFSFHNYDSLISSSKLDPRRPLASVETSMAYRAIQAGSVGDVAELKRLLAFGHDLDQADYDGRTPLHLACAENRLEAVKFLLDHGASPNPKDRWGNTPLDDAQKNRYTAIVDLFAPQIRIESTGASLQANAA